MLRQASPIPAKTPVAPPPARDWRAYLKPLASLRLTVVLLSLTMIVVFAGTWAQIDEGIWQVQKTYFHSFFCWIGMHLFLPREPLATGSFWAPIVAMLKPIRFPMLGGYSIIALLLLNLLAAHTVRFKFTKKRIGVILIHAGLIALLLGEVVTSVGQVESRMTITEGQTVSYSEDVRSVELAIVDHSPSDHDNVLAIPDSRLSNDGNIQDAKLPFDVKVDAFYPNSAVFGPVQAQQRNITPPVTVTAGMGQQVVVTAAPQVSGTDGGRIDAPSAYITLAQAGKAIGTYLVTTHFDEPQSVEVGGKTYDIALRWKRLYKPYSVHLIDFAFDRYTGTDVPKNYSSLVRLNDPSAGGEHEVKIWMNHPLRHAGETLYQASFDRSTEKTTVLQVVRNPGWLVPYIACSVITLGLLVHFGIVLMNFVNRGAGAPARQTDKGRSYTLRPARGNILIASIVTGFCIIYLLAAGRPAKQSGRFDLHSFGRVPISYEGRVLPLDSLARNSLRIISGKSTFKIDGESKPAIAWLVEVFAKPDAAVSREVFRIDYPELLSALGLDPNRKTFSHNEIFAKPTALQSQFSSVSDPKHPQTPYEKAIIELADHVTLFHRLQEGATLFVAPPTNDKEDWKTLRQAMTEFEAIKGSELPRPNAGLAAYVSLLQTYAADKPDMFNEAADGYLGYLSRNMSDVAQRANFEVLFNDFEPFYHTMVLYVLAFVLVVVGWLGRNNGPLRATLHRTAFWVLALTLAFHTFGLVARIYISGRPPVTNLYSSAIFIGWFVVGFSLVMELIFKNGIGSLAASAIAFPTLLIAHFLANTTPGGDTMAMLQAVLDTNLWLATHVVVITLGYSATALAWILGVVYVIGGLFTPAFDDADSKKTMSRMIYGTVCFAMLFSFVGTILGGIWADQSWGRFWGWDPKENGAVLIVIWNAIVLHARWAGLVRERGLANLAIFGGVITAWSWFGTNMLGVGLHTYGFMDKALIVLCAYVAVQLLIIAVGLVPTRLWRSYPALAN